MSDAPENKRNGSRKSALDALVRDAKRDLTPRIDDAKWDAIEARLLEKVARPDADGAERPAASARPAKPADISPARLRLVTPNMTPDVNAVASPRARALRIGAAILAAAAAVAVVVKRDHGEAAKSGLDIAAVSQAELNAGSLRSAEGSGEVRVGGQAVAPGHVLRAGDVLETTRDARAVLQRPRKVTWLLEAREPQAAQAEVAGARASVKSAGESLVLGLDDGAIEAQVVPVASGEAFAVDVAAGGHIVRVAVHGTHLRVARAGNRVTVDLTEGVVSIGAPPRTGSTYGTLVTAPSHVEFDAANLDATLRIDHAPASVRAAIPLGPLAPVAPRDPSVVAARPEQPSPRAIDPHGTSPSPMAPAAPGAANAGALATVPRPPPVHPADPTQPEPVAKVEPGKPALPPRDAIARAVRDCAALRSRPENVRVTVTSSLKLKIAAGGDVETAQFDPPLLPEIQSCAAAAIYKAKLADAAQGSVVTIPIDFSY